MPVTFCPECDGDIKLSTSPRKGDQITCPNCGAYLEVVGLSPIELDWADDEYDFEQDYEYEEEE
jgi:lysine biosynthesis protein LysW